MTSQLLTYYGIRRNVSVVDLLDDATRILGALTMFDNIDEIECLKAVEKFFTAEGEMDMDLLSSSDLDSDLKDQLMKCYLQSCDEIEALNKELRELNEQKLAAEERVDKVRAEAIEQKIYAARLEEELSELEQKENLINDIMDTAENMSIVKVSCQRVEELQNFYSTKRFDTLHDRIITHTEQETTQNLLRPSTSSPSLHTDNVGEVPKSVQKSSSATDLTHSSDFGPALKLEFKTKSRGVAVHIQPNIDKGRPRKWAPRKEQKYPGTAVTNKARKPQKKRCLPSCGTKTIYSTISRGEGDNVKSGQNSNVKGSLKSQKKFSQSEPSTDTYSLTKRSVPESLSDPDPGSTSSKKRKP